MAGRGQVDYRLVLETNDFQKALTTVGHQFEEFGKTLLAGFVTFEVGAKAAEMLTETIKGVPEAIIGTVEQVTEMAHQLEILSLKTGLSTQTLQELKFAAGVTGGSLDQLAGMINKMEKNLVAGSAAFGALGLSVAKLRAETPEQAFDQIAEKIRGLKSPTDQAAAAMAIFGKAGGDTLALIKSGVGELSNEAHRLGAVLSDDDVAAAAELSMESKKLAAAWEGLQNQFGATIAHSPELRHLIEDITKAITDLARYIHDHAKEITDFANMLAGIGRTAITGIRGITGLPFGSGNSISASAELAPEGGGHFNLPDKAAIERAERLKKILDEPLLGSAWGSLLGGGTGGLVGANAFKDNLAKLADDAKSYYAAIHKGEHDAAAAERLRLEIERQEDAVERARVAQALAKNQAWVASLHSIGNAILGIGQSSTGAFGAILTLGGGAINVFAALNDKVLQAQTTTQKLAGALQGAQAAYGAGANSSSYLGGALGGAAAGAAAGAAFGPWGAVIGGVGGAILGLFGHAKRAREELEKLRKQSMQTFEDLKKKLAEVKMEYLTKGVEGLAAMFKYAGDASSHLLRIADKIDENGKHMKRFMEVSDLTQEHLDRLGVVGMAMFEALRQQGLSTVDALEKMGPALDQALAAAQRAGLEMGGMFGVLVEFRNKVLANQDLVNAVDGWAAAFDALNATGNLTVDLFGKLQLEAEGYITDLVKAGFSHEQIMAMMAGDLYRLYKAQQQYGFALDDTTQAMINEELASHGFDNMADPMQKLVEIQNLMLQAIAALVKAFGKDLPAAVQHYIDALNNVPTLPGAPAAPGGSGGGSGEHEHHGGEHGHAAGLHTWIPATPGGVSLGAYGIAGEGGEPEYLSITPQSQMGGVGGGAVANFTIPFNVGGERLGDLVFSLSKRGLLRIHESAIVSHS